MGARNAPPHPAELGQGGGPEGATPGSLSPESLPDEKVAEGAGVPFLQVWAGHQAILGEESARGEGQVARSAEGRGGRGRRREARASEAVRDTAGLWAARGA